MRAYELQTYAAMRIVAGCQRRASLLSTVLAAYPTR